MRTTMNTVYAKTLANLNKLTSGMDDINTRLSSGRELNKISDNPVNMVGALNLRTAIAEISQYEDNLQYGNTMITAGDSALTQIKNQILEAKTIAIEAQNPAVAPNRSSIAPKVDNLISQAITLANTQINGKYIFGGFRTSGYTEKEPAPFLRDFIDGYRLNGCQPATQSLIPSGWSLPDGEVQSTGDLAANALEFYYPSTAVTESVGTVDLTTVPEVDGLNMTGALNLRDQINTDTAITASLTTLVAGGATTSNGPADQMVNFTVNGHPLNFSIPANATTTEVAQFTIDAINTSSDTTGVQAELGDGTNGGVTNAIVLRNVQAGDENAINLVGINIPQGALLNLQDGDSSAADGTHNTGQVHLDSATPYTFGATAETDLQLTGFTGGTTLNQGWTVQDGLDLAIGDLEFASTTIPPVVVQVGAVDLTNSGSTRYGINPLNTTNLKDAINIASPTSGVIATTTTQIGGLNPATTGNQAISLSLTGSVGGPIPITFTANGTATEIASQTIDAINDVSNLTGIEAIRGNNGNGGINDSIILQNIEDGNEGGITITGLPPGGPEAAILGFDNFDSIAAADFDNNTGEIFLSAANEFNYGSTSAPVLQAMGLTNTTIAPNTLDSNDIATSYSTHKTGTLGLHDLRINGIWIPAANHDAISTALPEFSAAAKAAAINSIADQTGVTAEITPPKIYGGGAVEAGTLFPGDIIINGVDIFNIPTGTTITTQDVDNIFINAINTRQDDTGVMATRTDTGTLILKAIDGRNIQVETSANGENIGHINGSTPPDNSSEIYIGQIQLISDRTYMLESTLFGPTTNIEAGLIALGLDGGQAVTGEPADQIGDGKVSALSIIDHPGNIRYTGDRYSELEIKVGKTDSLTIAQNGQTALMDTRAFNELQNLKDALLGVNFTEVTSLHRANDLTATLDSGNTGFNEDEYQFSNGAFDVTITDHDHQPPQTFTISIGIDTSVDNLTSIANKLNGIPGLNTTWNADNYLVIHTDDSERYSLQIDNDSSHFTDIVNITSEDMQVHAIDNSIASFDIIMDNLTTQISNFGARANRITVQNKIFGNLKLANQENLSEKQDTDFIKAVMDLKAKEVAYQAALSSASKIMQLSLVDYLK